MLISARPWAKANKPQKHAAILDWGKPLTTGMTSCFLFDEPGLGLRDLVTNGPRQTGSFPDVVGTAIRYDDPSPVYTTGLYTDASYITHQPGAMHAPYQFGTSNAFTFAFGGWWRARQFTGSIFGGVFDTTRTNHIDLWSGAGLFRVKWEATTYEFTQLNFDTVSADKWSDYVVTWNGNKSEVTWHVFSPNGWRNQTLSTTDSPVDLGFNPYLSIGTHNGLNTNQAHRGWYCYWYTWNRCLTSAEIVSVANNPFGVFQSQLRYYPIPEIAGAGGGFFSRYYYDMITQSRIGA